MTISPKQPVSRAEAARFVREHDWSSSTLGVREHWPAPLLGALNLMFASPTCMLLVWGPQHLLFANDAGCTALGLAPHLLLGKPAASVAGLPWHSLGPYIMQALAGHSTQCESMPVSCTHLEPPQTRWWTLSCSPLSDSLLAGEDSPVAGALCVVHDLTAQVNAQAVQQQEHAFSQRVLASINDCIKVLDLEARLTFMNEGGQKIMEVSDFNDVHGCPWPDFWEGQGNLEARAAVAAARAGQSRSFTGMAETLGGKRKWWHVHVSPVLGKNGQPEKILCVSRDMTALYDAEEALRALNDSLEQRVQERTLDRDRIWQLSTDLMLVARFDGTIHALNPAWNSVLGWDEASLPGGDFMHLVHPDDVEPTLAAMGNLAHGLRIADFKNRYRHADGSYRTIAWAAVPDQQFIHAVGRDIQAQVEASEALRITEESLRQAQKLEAIGQLTGGVAHDFNNLLTVIKSCTDLLKPEHLPEAKRMRYVEAISSTVDRAARLTGQLLAFARRQALQPQVFDLNESVSRIGEMMDSLTGSRIQVGIELPGEPCYIYADGSQFDTALINMVVNARDAMDGVGQLTIRVERVEASALAPVTSLAPGAYVAITLTDTGSGIAADKLGLIFEPFYTTKGVGQGTGLGLSQVFGFVKQSGGEVAVHSELGSGSRFTLYLPSATHPEQAPMQHSRPVLADSGLRVLMVEDNPQIGTYTSAMLEQSGFKVVWAAAAEQALEVLRTDPEPFDVVFSDIAMPGMSGVELYANIQQAWPGMPVILTSGYSIAFADLNREPSQRFELLQKPYRIEDLCARLYASARPTRSESS